MTTPENYPVIYEGWIAVKATGLDRHVGRSITAKMTKNKPSLGANEVAVKLGITLPVSLFVKPSVEAKINVAESDAVPLRIEMDVAHNIEDLIQQQTGFDVRIVQEGDE